MSTPHTSPTTTKRRSATAMRLLVALAAALLFVTACGSSANDDETSVAAGDDTGTPAGQLAGQDGDEAGDETETPTDVPDEAPTEAPAEEPTEAPDPTEEPTEAPDPTETPTEEPTEAPDEPVTIPIEMPDLVGPQWYVQAVDAASGDVEPRPNGAVATITFNEDGTVTGNAACNDFSADYAIDGADLSITNFAITEMACFIPDWSAFVEFLPETTGFGSAGGPDPILFVGNDRSISLGSSAPAPVPAPGDPADSPIADYIGLTEIEAAALADSRGVDFRVASIDGEPQMLTMDFIEDRVNVDLVDGVVVSGLLG